MEVKKRIIGAIIIHEGQAVQSIGYKRYLPLGRPHTLAENLDRWGADEILILSIDQSKKSLGPDLEFLSQVANQVNTPLIYGGGIKNVTDALNAIHAGADRIVIDSLFRESIAKVKNIAEVIGSQAVILSVPLALTDGKLYLYDYINRSNIMFSEFENEIASSKFISELLVMDCYNDGKFNSFDAQLLDHLKLEIPLILYGGISELKQVSSLMQNNNVAAIGIGNFLNYQELSIQKYKRGLEDTGLVRENRLSLRK
jgi:imidazole glycerol-phosphate synthase subunit HisF